MNEVQESERSKVEKCNRNSICLTNEQHLNSVLPVCRFVLGYQCPLIITRKRVLPSAHIARELPPVRHISALASSIRITTRDTLCPTPAPRQARLLLRCTGCRGCIVKISDSPAVSVRRGFVGVVRRAVDELGEGRVQKAKNSVDGSLKSKEDVLELAWCLRTSHSLHHGLDQPEAKTKVNDMGRLTEEVCVKGVV